MKLTLKSDENEAMKPTDSSIPLTVDQHHYDEPDVGEVICVGTLGNHNVEVCWYWIYRRFHVEV